MVPGDAPRATFQRFEVIDRLGSGASGAVYRAWDPQLQREVAIKVIARPAAEARGTLPVYETVDLRRSAPDDALREARIMARLSHPNVLPVYEVGLADDELFVVMERVAGADLRTWLAAPRSSEAIRDAFAQAARGLAAAHGQGVIHRDFKPENVLVGDDGRVRVADFGLSHLSAAAAPGPRVELPIGGTPYYMAPELWHGAAASEASDVFALCTAIAEAFGNEPGGRDALDRDLAARGCDRPLRAAVARGLAEDPAARPALDALIAALAPRRTRRWWWLAAAPAVAAAVVAVVMLRGAGEPAACAAERVAFAGTWDVARGQAIATAGITGPVERYRHALEDARGATCAAQRRGDLTPAQALGRAGCLQRRGFELDALATRLIAEQRAPAVAGALVERLTPPAECSEVLGEPLAADAEAVRALYARMVVANGRGTGAAARAAELAAVEHDALAIGDRELAGRAAVSLGMRQIEADELPAADASLARGHDLAVALHDTATTVTALIERAVVAEQSGDASAARSFGKLARELADKPGAPPPRRAQVYYSLARIELARGDPNAAVAMVRGGIEALAEQPDPDREIALRIVEIAALRNLGGHDDQVLALARKNLEASRAILHKDDMDLGVALNTVALALRDNGDPGAALDYRRQALDVMAHAAPADHVYVLGQRMNVALDLAATGAFEAARVEATAVLALAANKPAAEARRGLWLGDLASFTCSTGRIADGLALFEQGLEQMSAQFGRDHPDVLEYRIVRLELEIEAGKLAEAEQHIAALERTYRTRGDHARDLTRLDGIDRGELALARHRPADAEVRARAALAAWSELHGNEEDREQLLRILGESLVDQRRWGEALEVLDRASAIWHARHELPDRLAQIDVQRARALAGAHKLGDAVALARRARASLERFPADLRARAAADAFLAAHGRRDAARRRGDPR